MLLNMKLEGLPEDVLNTVVKMGIASSKSEAVRIMILHYNEHFGIKPISPQMEREALVRKISQIDSEIAAGKRKVYTEHDMLKKYPHLKDV